MVFTASVPVAQLHPHQALALINRWVKLKGYWFYDDRDALYELKDELIRQWVEEGVMIATKVIQRESAAIEGMKAEILSGGMNLSHLNRMGINWWDILSQAKYFPEWHVLVNMVNDEIQVPLSEAEQKQLVEIYEQEKAEYEELERQYNIDLAAYRNDWKDFQKNIQIYLPILEKELSALL